MKHLLYRLAGRLPCRIISDDGRPYLERYYLATILGVRFYLHRFVGSDPARGLHDHPWPWAGSLVLSGFYFEERRGNNPYHMRAVRWFNWLTGDTFHRVVLHSKKPLDEGPGEPCWTLFFHRAANVKPWGFLRPRSENYNLTWIPHDWDRGGNGSGHQGEWWKTVPIGKLEPRRMAP